MINETSLLDFELAITGACVALNEGNDTPVVHDYADCIARADRWSAIPARTKVIMIIYNRYEQVRGRLLNEMLMEHSSLRPVSSLISSYAMLSSAQVVEQEDPRLEAAGCFDLSTGWGIAEFSGKLKPHVQVTASIAGLLVQKTLVMVAELNKLETLVAAIEICGGVASVSSQDLMNIRKHLRRGLVDNAAVNSAYLQSRGY